MSTLNRLGTHGQASTSSTSRSSAAKDIFNRPLTTGGVLEVQQDPPGHAKTIYCVVIVSQEDYEPVSLRNPSVKYKTLKTYRQVEIREAEGAFDGMAALEDAVVKEDKKLLTEFCTFGPPGASSLLQVAKAKAWNLKIGIPKKFGAKMHYDYFRVLETVPIPRTLIETFLPKPTREWSRHCTLQATCV